MKTGCCKHGWLTTRPYDCLIAPSDRLDRAARHLKTCTDIVHHLIKAVQDGDKKGGPKDLNLNAIKIKCARDNKMAGQPRLVDIIAAIPEEYRKVLVPRLKAKPVRTASGVSVQAKRGGRNFDVPC